MSRRSALSGIAALLSGAALSRLAAAAEPQQHAAQPQAWDALKIKEVEPIVYRGHRANNVLVKITTAEGLIGYGEASLEYKALSVAQSVKELTPLLAGEDAHRIEHLWQKLYEGHFWKGGPILMSAISGIEQALWDLKGKALGVPVYQLLGGRCRDRIRMYGHAGGDTADELVASVLSRLEQSELTAVKFMPIRTSGPLDLPAVAEAAKRVGAVRRAVGDNIDICVEVHGMLNPAMALQVADAIAEFRPLWFEEPCPPENVAAMVEIARGSKVPIATGERLYTVYGFAELLAERGAAIVQPDICHCGGLLQVKKIAALAEGQYALVAPHNPNGVISTAASMQVDVCTHNFLIQEHSFTSTESTRLGEYLLQEPLVMKSGYLEIPTAPGLGVAIDEEKLKRLPPYQPDPVYDGVQPDGAFRRR